MSLFISSSSLLAQYPDFVVDKYTIEDGLSQTSVNCMIQDSRGFIWIGTQDGLNKFDGYNFITFRNHPQDSTTISYNHIRSIIEDSEGNLWIGTDYGLNKYNYKSGIFKRYLHEPNNPNSLRENEIFNVYQDKKGIVWIKTRMYLTKFDPTTNKFRHYEHYNDIFNLLSQNTNLSIFEDSFGMLWVGTKDGLNYFDRELEIFKRYYNIPSDPYSLSHNRVNSITEDSNGNLWIGTDDGLNRFDRARERFEVIKNDPNNLNSLSNNVVNEVVEDRDGVLWVCTNDGINEYLPGINKFRVYREFTVENRTVLASAVTNVLQDKTGILWLGTMQGLFKFQKKLKKFDLYSHSDDNEPLFTNNYIYSIYEESPERLWIGTWETGLHIFNRKTGKVQRFTSEENGLVNDFIHSIFEDSKGTLWIGTQNGINTYDFGRKTFSVPWSNETQKVFKNNRVFSIYEDADGIVWFATRYGLHYWDGEVISSLSFEYENENSLSSNWVYKILQDKQGYYWIATKNGLDRMNENKTEFVHYNRTLDHCDNCISNNEVLCMFNDDANGVLWLGTVSGLNRFEKETENFTIYTELDGLPNNMIYEIIDDSDGNLWLSTNRGLSMMDKETKKFTNFSVADGLQNYEFNIGAVHKSASGELFFGGISGLNCFYPDSIEKNLQSPDIVITNFELSNNKERLQYGVEANDKITIPFRHTMISIEFASLDFTNPEKNLYAYKMEGVEDEWIDHGNRRYATFSNLRPGEYRFWVKGSNSDLVWSQEGAYLDIIVETPFWMTTFSYVVYIILGVSGLIFLFQYRTRSLRRSNQKLKEKEEIAKQVAIQKEELTIKNKDITDSIVYAKRIQESLLPSRNMFFKILPNSFILHKPKDIVSGDFYWINEKDDKVFIAVVDCTGHGVPGAFMSIIGVELLRKITDDLGIYSADEILEELNKGIELTFGKEGSDVVIKDGMDLALCVIDKKKNEMEFAGAFRPLYYVRDNKIEEIKGDRFSVGLLNENEVERINKTTIQLKDGDIFYMFTDGYADQFGGPEGKKYKYRRFRHLLLTIHKLAFEQQKTYIDKSIEEWRGELEQVDDILILGFEVNWNKRKE